MAFNISVGDFFTVGQFAWSVYKSCRGAGGAFEEISHEVISLHTAIKELQDEAENPDSIFNRSGAAKNKELAVLVQNCNGALRQLNALLIKYNSLGTKSTRTWDRLRWGKENLAKIREKIMSHTSSLTLFLTTLGTSCLGRIEKKLDQLILDVKAGKREGSVLSIADDDDDDAEVQWDLWKRELLEDGFTKVELETHKNWIKAKLVELIENGGLHDEPLTDQAGNSKPTPTFQPKTPTTERTDHYHDSGEAINGVNPGKHTAFEPTGEEMDDYEREFRVTSTDIRLSFLNEIDDIFGHSGSGEESKSSACLSAPSSPFILSSPSLNSVTEVPLRVTLEELLNGIRKKIKVKRRDNLEEEFLEVDVKPGMKQGTKIKFENFGNTEGGQRNLHFVIEEKQHPIFSRKGNDLQMKLQLDLVESLCGFSRVLQPLDKQTIWIEKTRPTQPGSSGRLPNLGMPLLGVPGQRGALIIKYVVKYPTTLSPSSMIKLRDALKQEMPQ